MFKYLPLVWANLRRKQVRSVLTMASIAVAFLLFAVLAALRAALSAGIDSAGQDRLVTQHKITSALALPYSYLERVRATPGVTVATTLNLFGGIYQDYRNTVTAYAVTKDGFFPTFPDIKLDDAAKSAFLSDRTAAIVGKALAQRYGWKVGQTIPLGSNRWLRQDGGNIWDMKIVGVYERASGDNSALFFRYDYFNETRRHYRDSMGIVVFRVDNPDQAATIARRIDDQFANSSVETRTATEYALIQSFLNQVGNVGGILLAVASAVFFTVLVVTANTMSQSVRDRTNELAVMKTVGFSRGRVMLLVLSESLLITLIGGAIGLALSFPVVEGIGVRMQEFLPFNGVPASTYGQAIGLIVVLGVLSGGMPCWRASQLRITEALRRA